MIEPQSHIAGSDHLNDGGQMVPYQLSLENRMLTVRLRREVQVETSQAANV